MGTRRLLAADMVGGQHRPQSAADGAGRIGKKIGNARERLFFLRVKHMENGADEKRVGGLLPVVAPLSCAFRIDENVGNVLHIANFIAAAAHLEERIEPHGLRAYRIEQQAVGESRPPAGRQRPVFTFKIVNDGRARPGKERWDDKADALARPRRRHRQNMLRTVMAEIAILQATEDDALIATKA